MSWRSRSTHPGLRTLVPAWLPLALRLTPGAFSRVTQRVLETLIPGAGGSRLEFLGGLEGFSLRLSPPTHSSPGHGSPRPLCGSLCPLLCTLTRPWKMPPRSLPGKRLCAGRSQLSAPSPPRLSQHLLPCRCSPNSRDTGRALPGVLWPPATGLRRPPISSCLREGSGERTRQSVQALPKTLFPPPFSTSTPDLGEGGSGLKSWVCPPAG